MKWKELDSSQISQLPDARGRGDRERLVVVLEVRMRMLHHQMP
jgi:hypothetical protein